MLVRLQNLVRGRGLLCRSIMKSQMASPTFSNIYAALVAVINTKFPEFGELLLTRVILQVRKTSENLLTPAPPPRDPVRCASSIVMRSLE